MSGEQRSNCIHSKMEAEANGILNTRKYKKLKRAFPCPEKFGGSNANLHKQVLEYCDLLRTLTNDKMLWEQHEIPECIFHVLRLRYMIIGNILKAIFMIHERNKKTFLKVFKKEYVKTFTFAQSDKKVKIVVLSPIENKNLDLNVSRASRLLQSIPTMPTDRNAVEILPVNRFENENQELNDSRALRSVQAIPTTCVDIHTIEVLPDDHEVINGGIVSKRTASFAGTSSRMVDDELNEEMMRVRQFVMEAGIDIEDIENIRTEAELHEFIEKNVNIQPRMHATNESQCSDDDERGVNLVVHAEVHPVPREGILLGSTEDELISNQIQIDRGNANATTGADNVDRGTQIIQEMLPSLAVTPSMQKPVDERQERPSYLVHVQNTVKATARPSIAELMLQSARRRIPSAILSELDRPEPFIEMLPSDVPRNIDQRTKPQNPPLRLDDIFVEPAPVPKPRVKRKKYTFYSRLVISRKMKKIVKRPTHVSNAEKVQNFVECRHNPGEYIIPFDEYESDQPAGHDWGFIPRIRGSFGDELPNGGNMMNSLLCQLFERTDENELIYDEENEVDYRKAILRASISRHQNPVPPRRIPHSLNKEKMPTLKELLSKYTLLSGDASQPGPSPPAPTSGETVASLSAKLTLAQTGTVQSETARSISAIEAAGVEVHPTENVERIPTNPEHVARALMADQKDNEQDTLENISPQRPLITNDLVLDKTTSKWMENSGESIRFTDLCPFSGTNRFTAAKTFTALLDLHRKKMVKLDQEPTESWSPESLTISPP